MPKTRTPEQRERDAVRHLRTLRREVCGDQKVLELFIVELGVVYRIVRAHDMPSGETREEMIATLDRLATDMIPESVRYSVEDEGSYGDSFSMLVATGRRTPYPGEMTVYYEVMATEEEKRAKAAAERDAAELARLRKKYPDQFKET